MSAEAGNSSDAQQAKTSTAPTSIGAGGAVAAGAAAAPMPAPKKYVASIYPDPGAKNALDDKFAEAVLGLGKTLAMPVWLLLQNSEEDAPRSQISEAVRNVLWTARTLMPKGSPIALLIDSPGGYAQSAYQIAMQIRHRCGGFTAIVPRYAKSAATLLTLGANNLMVNREAELGPLDVQILDYDREERTAALDEVQMLERLHASALESLDQTMMLLTGRTGKKLDTILPHALKFTADMMRPMLEKVDVVHYTQRARALKVAEEYAIRLLKPKYSSDQAKTIARHLVEKYPEHEFVIGYEELEEIGLVTTTPTDEQFDFMDSIVPYLGKTTIIGQLEEVKP